MTAPIIHKSTKSIQELSLRTSSYQLLNAIDENDIEKVEISMSTLLKNDVPEVSIRLFYNYANRKNKVKVCEYFRLLLIVAYNTKNTIGE